MPRVLERTPQWLIRPAPGSTVFEAKPKANATQKDKPYDGPTKTIAHGRGTEIFVAHGNELRWADLRTLKDDFQETDELHEDGVGRRNTTWRYGDSYDGAYRILSVGGHGPIRQLVVSPAKDYMAIVRSHTIYVMVLPPRHKLDEVEQGPLKPKSFQLGETCHVLESSPIVSLLWHPLGELGRCIVTITADSVVRLWEVNREDRISFSEPSLSVDLKKLANATSAEQDLHASKYGSGKTFSPDTVELEPAAACFGGSGEVGEYPWRSMTLWIAMKEGDVYALCPLLPKRWQAHSGLTEALFLLIAANAIDLGDRRANTWILDAQEQFVSQVQNQQPYIAQGPSEFAPRQVYTRPQYPGSVPMLQGPFDALDPDTNEDIDLTDILVFGVGSEDLEEDETQPPVSVICLLLSSGTIHIFLDLEGVEAQWLPLRTGTAFSTPKKGVLHSAEQYRTLLEFETIKLSITYPFSHPSFTRDVCNPHAFFVTSTDGVNYVSMASWVRKIEREFNDPTDAGGAFRIQVFLDGAQSLVECPIRFRKQDPNAPTYEAAAAIVLADTSHQSSMGYLIVTSFDHEPYTAQLDITDNELYLISDSSPLPDEMSSPAKPLLTHEPREIYRADPTFGIESTFPEYLRKRIPPRFQSSLKEEVKLSPATLEIVTEAHRILSNETHRVGIAAADLWRQCQKLQKDFVEQIGRAREVKNRIDTITGDDDDVYEEDGVAHGTERLEQRLDAAKKKQRSIIERHEALKKRLTKASVRKLSDKEKVWIAEVEKLKNALPEGEERDEAPLLLRYDVVTGMGKELISEGKAVEGEKKLQGSEENDLVKVPEGFRKAKVKCVWNMLEREKALVEATTERLQKLGVQT